MDVPYVRSEVGVEGGSLMVGRWGVGDRVVVASHGITANHMSFQRIGELVVELSDGACSLVAVDHRGRAGSVDVPGPFGLAAHAEDLIVVLDSLEIAKAQLVGHSMGGFVVTAAAEHHPDRVERLILVDGGLPLQMDLPADADVEAVVQAVIGPALDRLDMRWPDTDSYLDMYRGHPAFQPPNEWSSTIEANVRHDATVTPEGDVRAAVSKEAVLVDGGAAITDPHSAAAIERITTPSVLLWAPRGLFDQTPGLYPPEQVANAVKELPHLDARLVEDVNHYTIGVSEHGALAVVREILGL